MSIRNKMMARADYSSAVYISSHFNRIAEDKESKRKKVVKHSQRKRGEFKPGHEEGREGTEERSSMGLCQQCRDGRRVHAH